MDADRRARRRRPTGLLSCLALLGVLIATGCAAQSVTSSSPGSSALWRQYSQRFVTDDGRVVDTGNGGVSHTEGQGWGMLLAVANNDRARFDALWDWTRKHLRRSEHELFAWRYDPRASVPVADTNNASDGDLLIAWALSEAADQWKAPALQAQSVALRGLIVRHLVRRVGPYTVLLPARRGFEHDGYVNLNLSYLVTPALQRFAREQPDGPWQALIDDGDTLLNKGRFGEPALPPDWLQLTEGGRLSPADGWPARFGFEAVRVPLYWVWAGITGGEALVAIDHFWRTSGPRPPAWVDLNSGARADYPLSRGGLAVRALLQGHGSRIPASLSSKDDYYSASLLMLANLAAQANGGR